MSVISASANFTRPANTTAYAANDLVANTETAGSVVPMSFLFPAFAKSFRIFGIKVQKSGTTPTNGNFHLRLYGASPTCANGDNSAWSTNLSSYFGKLDPTIVEAFTDGSAVVTTFAEGSDLRIDLGTGTTVYGLMVADAAYTPASEEVFTVTLYGYPV